MGKRTAFDDPLGSGFGLRPPRNDETELALSRLSIAERLYPARRAFSSIFCR
jgi:hypothetical protein